MRFLTFLTALALMAGAVPVSAGPNVRVLTTGPDEGGAACGVCIVQEEPGVHVMPLGDRGGATAWASGCASSGPPKKMKLPYLGVAASSASEVLRQQLGLPPGTGLVVDYVDEEGPAHKAGIRAHDVLTKLGDQILVNPPQLAVLVRMHKAGDGVAVTLVRGGKEQRLSATLVEKEQVVAAPAMGMGAFGALAPPVPPQALNDLLRQGNLNIRIEPRDVEDGQKGGQHATGSTVATGFSLSMADGEHTLTVEQRDGKRHLVAKDADGKVLFDGPITTEEERQRVPEEIRKKLDCMDPHVVVHMHADDALEKAKARIKEARERSEAERRALKEKAGPRKPAAPQAETKRSSKSHAEVHVSDGVHDLHITSEGGKRHLVARDADGNVLFDGPITTDEQMQRVPEEIREKVRGIQVHCGSDDSTAL